MQSEQCWWYVHPGSGGRFQAWYDHAIESKEASVPGQLGVGQTAGRPESFTPNQCSGRPSARSSSATRQISGVDWARHTLPTPTAR